MRQGLGLLLLQLYDINIWSEMMRQICARRLIPNAFPKYKQLYTPLRYSFQCSFKLYFPFSLDNSYLTQRQKPSPYEQYTANLKDPHWLKTHLSRIQYLLGHTHTPKNLHYNHLRTVINELLLLSIHATNARSYHPQTNFNPAHTLNQIASLIKLTFSQTSNISHESIHEQQRNTYEFIQFPAYFRICNAWNTPIDPQVLQYYLHSYMHLLFDRSFLKYISVFDVLRESQPVQATLQIIGKSRQGIIGLMDGLREKIGEKEVLNPYEAAVYIMYLINHRNVERPEGQQQEQMRTLHNYILNSSTKYDPSVSHCENITYSLYLLYTSAEIMSPHYLSALDWQYNRLQQMVVYHRKDHLMHYLASLDSHEDKITCLKVDIWLTLLNQIDSKTHIFDARPHIYSIVGSIHSLSFQFWRYKYLFWLMDSLLNTYLPNNLHLIKRICAFLPSIIFHSHDKIGSVAIFVGEVTRKYNLISDTMPIHEAITSWLVTIPKQSLKTQLPSDLCDILSTADNHPSLQSLYTPYLCILLQLSLGHFHWTDLTRLYYYGLKFEVQADSEQAKWNMEYVRRYILNQYATMGLRRREIPEDSYFYKIIGITTPEKFYENYLKTQ